MFSARMALGGCHMLSLRQRAPRLAAAESIAAAKGSLSVGDVNLFIGSGRRFTRRTARLLPEISSNTLMSASVRNVVFCDAPSVQVAGKVQDRGNNRERVFGLGRASSPASRFTTRHLRRPQNVPFLTNEEPTIATAEQRAPGQVELSLGSSSLPNEGRSVQNLSQVMHGGVMPKGTRNRAGQLLFDDDEGSVFGPSDDEGNTEEDTSVRACKKWHVTPQHPVWGRD